MGELVGSGIILSEFVFNKSIALCTFPTDNIDTLTQALTS